MGGSLRGAHLGVSALKVGTPACRFFAKCQIDTITADHAVTCKKSPFARAKYVKEIYQVLSKATVSVERIMRHMREESILFVFSGDHSATTGVLAGVRRALPRKRVGVVWIDAHADLQTPYTTPSGNMHGMPLAMAFGEDNLSEQKNTPTTTEVAYWEQAKALGQPNKGVPFPSLQERDVVFIGLRDVDPEERALMVKYDLPVFSVAAVRKEGAARVVEKTLAHLSACDVIYVSFDVDSLDTSLSVGTGTPVDNGLFLEEAIAINRGLMRAQKTKIWEMTEINPLLDNKNSMAQAGYEVLRTVEAAYEQRKA